MRAFVYVHGYPAGKSCHITHVRLASLDDGRPVIISGAQQLCTAVANHQLGVDRIDVGHVQSLLTGKLSTACASCMLIAVS